MTERVLILGATGMLGYTLFMHSLSRQDLDTYAAVRDSASLTNWFPAHALGKIIQKVDAYNNDSITRAVAISQPDIIINCIGLVKQTPLASDPLAAIPINALLPHRLAMICKATGARLIHISTDCVFSGSKGNYSENDDSDANDLYGRTKYLGEVSYLPHCVTLRTSIIGHELKGKIGLLEWFLSQNEKIKGYTKAIFSGFPTIELAQIILERVLPNPHLAGVIFSFAVFENASALTTTGLATSPSPSTLTGRSMSVDQAFFEQDFRRDLLAARIECGKIAYIDHLILCFKRAVETLLGKSPGERRLAALEIGFDAGTAARQMAVVALAGRAPFAVSGTGPILRRCLLEPAAGLMSFNFSICTAPLLYFFYFDKVFYPQQHAPDCRRVLMNDARVHFLSPWAFWVTPAVLGPFP